MHAQERKRMPVILEGNNSPLVLFDKVQVIPSDNDCPHHFRTMTSSSKNTPSNWNRASEWAFLVDVRTLKMCENVTMRSILPITTYTKDHSIPDTNLTERERKNKFPQNQDSQNDKILVHNTKWTFNTLNFGWWYYSSATH